MMYEIYPIDMKRVNELLGKEENYLCDLKSKDIKPAKLSQSISAFANASGGDIYVGINEEINGEERIRKWDGFSCIENTNGMVQMLANLAPLQNFYDITYLKHPTQNTYVMQINVFKTLDIVTSTDGSIYVREGAQKILVDDEKKLHRLKLDKGLIQFENEKVLDGSITDIVDSDEMRKFAEVALPDVDIEKWLIKQHLVKKESITVAGALLFMDEPQIVLPKRSAIKVYRYKTTGNADRDMLDGQPITVEGAAYEQIYKSIAIVKGIVEKIKKINTKFEAIVYPDEAIHEIVTNAVLHRDYSIPTDIQIRIFDNRVEIESPGKLPGLVTVQNILDSQAARNPKLVRIINKFPEAPNKDVGEGLNTAFEAMKKLRLKPPEIIERNSSVLVTIKHEKLASPEQTVLEYLMNHEFIKNAIGRDITGIKSENVMKRVFYNLRDRNFIQMIKKRKVWIKTGKFMELIKEQFPDLLNEHIKRN